MARNDAFIAKPDRVLLPKNLRYNAHEYADWAHGLEPDQGGDNAITTQRYGRGASGESST
jgi:hypothetical protein